MEQCQRCGYFVPCRCEERKMEQRPPPSLMEEVEQVARQGAAGSAVSPRFSLAARAALERAERDAASRGSVGVATEHLFLGVLDDEPGAALGAASRGMLEGLGAAEAKIRKAVEFIIGRGPSRDAPGLTPRAARVIELAVAEARLLERPYIGTDALLLGLVREGEGIAAGVLDSLGVNLARTRASARLAVAEGATIFSEPLDRTAAAPKEAGGPEPAPETDNHRLGREDGERVLAFLTAISEPDYKTGEAGHALPPFSPEALASMAVAYIGRCLESAG